MKRSSTLAAAPIVLLALACAPGGTAGPSADASRLAEALVGSSGLAGGVCVVLGRGDAELPLAIGRQGRFVVQALYDDEASLDKARRRIDSAGLYGQVSADLADYRRLGYAENLVNVVVGDNWPALRSKGLTLEELFAVLTPRGVLLLGDSAASGRSTPPWPAELKQDLAAAGTKTAQIIRSNGLWVKAVKPWPAEIDEWSHFLHGPDGNPVADDAIVGPPKHYQWVAGPLWLRSHDSDSSISTVVTSGGRIFYIVDEAPISLPGNHALPDKWFLAARDAFNGTPLWKVPIEQWGWRQWKQTWFLCRPGDIPLNLEMRLVGAGDLLYATLGYRAAVSELDARTGRVVKTFEGTEGAREILHRDGTLIVTVPVGGRGSAARVVAIGARDGRRLWQSSEIYGGTTSDYIRFKAMHGSVKPAVLDPALNPVCDGAVVAIIDGPDIVCLDYATGEQKWRTRLSQDGQPLWLGALIAEDAVIVYADRTQLVGLSAATGKVLWRQRKSYLQHLWYEWKDVFVIDGLVWTWSAELQRGSYGAGRSVWPVSLNGYDLRTGRLERQVPTGPIFVTHHHHRCYRDKATSRYILTSRRGTEFFDLRSGRHTVCNWVRGTCHYGMLPANGLQYAPPHPCRCYIREKLNGFNALAPEIPDRYKKRNRPDGPFTEKGPAYGAEAAQEAGPADWPTFRHDAMRSSATPAKLPEQLEPLWKVRLGSKVSAPVVAGHRVFVALVDEHQVIALNAEDGKRLWRFFAGARVDSPPSYYRQMVLFGSADGWVYCLAAEDGRLRWRFRAAPQRRFIGAFGQLESAWPVHGSVLVSKGRVYFAAGRSSHLDGGIGLYCLDAVSGRVIGRKILEGPEYTSENITTNYGLQEGALPDVLSADDQFIYMRGYRFTRDLAGQAVDSAALAARGGFLDDTYFERAHWYFGKASNFARVMAVGDERVYLVRMFERIWALDPNHFFTPGDKGYTLAAQRRADLHGLWSRRLAVRVTAMVLAGDVLVTAGPPDLLDPADPLGAFEGRKGGLLNLFEAGSGRMLAEYKLDSPPVFNGAAAAAGRLYISQADGGLLCMAGK